MFLQYAGGRDASNFVEFLNGKCGTSRALGGKLSEDVSVFVCLESSY